MSESITLYSFGDFDRSGKVRWLARELGLDVVEERVGFGAHRAAPYTDLNPLGQIPAVAFRGRTLIESTAVCHELAEAFDDPQLWIGRGDDARSAYLFWLAAFGETLESKLVECSVSRIGALPPTAFELQAPPARRKLAVLAERLPADGWLCGDRFTLADIVAGYSLRLGVQLDFLTIAQAGPYLQRLRDRPAAAEARFFTGLD